MSSIQSNFPNPTSTSADSRISTRTLAELKTIVKVHDGKDDGWKEVTKVTTVSKNGAGFTLSRAVNVGRLLTLVMPMPGEFRAYDHDEELYPVMGLVQYCQESNIGDQRVFHVGVGFIGKSVPQSFKDDPRQSYSICGMTKSGLWQVTEADSPFKARKNSRYYIPIGVTVSLIRKDKPTNYREDAVTRNISASGASVQCSLDAEVGDRVKFGSKEHDFYAIAEVRNRKQPKDGSATLHIEFIDTEFPIEKLLFSEHAAVAA